MTSIYNYKVADQYLQFFIPVRKGVIYLFIMAVVEAAQETWVAMIDYYVSQSFYLNQMLRLVT